MENYLDTLTSKYAQFGGRADRGEFWTFTLVNVLVLVAINLAGLVLTSRYGQLGFVVSVLSCIFVMAVLIPAWAATVRRLHDTGRSGWWILLVLVPVVGPIVLLVLLALAGQTAENRFGPQPAPAA